MKSTLTFPILIVILLCLANLDGRAQDEQEGGVMMLVEVFHGDTFLVKYMPIVNIVEERSFRSNAEKRRFRRLEYNVKKMYPYAKLAGELLKKYEADLASVDSERAKKKFYKEIEDELKREFDGEIRKMSTAQGRILVKLIDRETGDTSYEIVQEFRGNMTAFFWQSFSKMFGQDLKSSYDPNGEDKEIEDIVQLILVGAI